LDGGWTLSAFALGAIAAIIVVLVLVIYSIRRHRDPDLRIECDAGIEKLLPTLSGLTLGSALEGNSAEVLVNGEFWDVLIEHIGRARHTVHFETFLWKEGALGRRVTAVLVARARAGVTVRVLLDATGCKKMGKETEQRLRDAGCKVTKFHERTLANVGLINQRDHRKIVVVDGVDAFAGGVNFSHAYRIASQQAKRGGFSKQEAIDEGWRDTHIGLRGTASKELERLFRDTWSRARCEGDLPAFSPQAVKGGDTLMQIVASTPADEQNVIYATLLSVITYAQKSIDITMAYFVPDDALEAALRDAARRGVRVRMILPSYSDFSGVFYAGRAHYRELLDSGVEIYELETAMLHAKTLCVDGVWSSVGSTNFDWRSFVHNDEISVCVIDQGFAQQMNQAFDHDLADSRQITLATWKKRGFAERFKELMWLPIQYWL